MSNPLYTKLAATTLRMLTKFGRSVTLRQYSQGAADYDPATLGTGGGVTYVDSTRQVLTADQPGSQIARHFGQTLQKGGQIPNKEKWLYMDASGDPPTLMDHVIFDGIDYCIVNVQVTSPGGTPLFYMLVLQS